LRCLLKFAEEICMRRLSFTPAMAALLSAVAIVCCAAQDDDEEEPFLPGLIAEHRQADREPVRRLDAVVAAHWTGRPDERLLADKPFSATWTGVLQVPDDGPYQLHVHARGDVTVEVSGKSVIDKRNVIGWASSPAQTLTYGPTPLRVTFTARGESAEISLFWSSDRFEREPIPARLLAHDRKEVVPTDFDRGRVLARALRCEACHAEASAEIAAQPMPAPALDQLAGNLHRAWLVDWLTANKPPHEQREGRKESSIERRMPYLSLTKEEAEVLADWLLDPALAAKPGKPVEQPQPQKSEKADPKKPVPSREAGEQLLLTRGCLACHRVGEFGESGLFGGGDLTVIAAKRPATFFTTWLQKPEALNRDHRMPVFDLSAHERQSLALALAGRGEARNAGGGETNHDRARELARKHRCDQCHRLPEAETAGKLAAPTKIDLLSERSRWTTSCAANSEAKKLQPVFGVGTEDAGALQAYFSQRQTPADKNPQVMEGAQLLVENNCLACHAREPQPAGVLPKKFGDKLVAVAQKFEDLASQVPAMTPPSLNSVGDKLTDQALEKAITRVGPAHRPYLLVQMPKFRLSKEQTAELAAHFIHTDRIPDFDRGPPANITPQLQEARTLAGKRLVGTDGFSCTSCHQVGSVLPVKAPPAARGPSLSLPQERLRKTWFDRFVRNPARIVPRMEMPTVQTPVRGVLADKLDDQLAAVWQVLSTPGFEPPLPEPVRTLRFYSNEDNQGKQPLLITDLIEHDGQTLERAALIGLPNRHNILFDFATNRLLAWSQGDLARQRTKGKNWYWEPAGSVLLDTGLKRSEFELELDGDVYEAVSDGQWLIEPAKWRLDDESVTFEYLQTFRKSKGNAKDHVTVLIKQTMKPFEDTNGRGLTRHWMIDRLPERARLIVRLVDLKGKQPVTVKQRYGEVRLETPRGVVLLEHERRIQTLPDGGMRIFFDRPSPLSQVELWARYRTSLPSDEYHAPRPPPIPFIQPPVTIAPGLSGERLTLPTDIMPTALAWRPNGDLVIASLKGHVMSFPRESLTTTSPQGELLADGLAAPYGIQAGSDYVDVVTKYGLLRLNRNSKDGASEALTVASGWGYTSDYHDWAVGLPRDAAGNYYLALPCYQDNRSEAAKRLRGSVLKLSPRRPTPDDQRLFGIEQLTLGHRFPMGMALNAREELFVSDNQGNYNPFNELNHVKPSAHFGFVNKGEKAPESHVAPTIAIPHPWTRSVNGICFLETPRKLAANGKKIFGPLEGHLVGCEYDTKRLIRMSLQKVAGDYQGCCYPLTVPTPAEEAPLGPICCEVSPAGELFIGSIRDSGWGAGNNIGEVIRVRFDESQLGHGLAEMRATATGFELDFFQPVAKALAEDAGNYSLNSYRRESTPAYGGSDIDRRTEKVAAAQLSPDGKRVTLTVPQLRAGYVYELHLKSLAPNGATFFPAEAHYTLRQLVK
jgi:hypothetical protein